MKSKAALLAISNCHMAGSGRMQYIEVLKRHINITQVGNCNEVACDKQCLDKLIGIFLFY